MLFRSEKPVNSVVEEVAVADARQEEVIEIKEAETVKTEKIMSEQNTVVEEVKPAAKHIEPVKDRAGRKIRIAVARKKL